MQKISLAFLALLALVLLAVMLKLHGETKTTENEKVAVQNENVELNRELSKEQSEDCPIDGGEDAKPINKDAQ